MERAASGFRRTLQGGVISLAGCLLVAVLNGGGFGEGIPQVQTAIGKGRVSKLQTAYENRKRQYASGDDTVLSVGLLWN